MEKDVLGYAELKEHIKKKIKEGIFKYGEAIPSERDLAASYGLNRLTVRAAIVKLVEEGLLRKVQGKGTFVTRPKISGDLSSIKSLSRVIIEQGFKPSTKLLFSGKRKAGYKFAAIFNIQEDEEIYRLLRLRLADNEPIAIEDTYVPYNLIKGIEDIDFQVYSLYDLFSANDIILDKAYESLTLTKVRSVEAKLLEVPDGSSIFLFEIKVCDTMGRTVEFTKSYVSGERRSFYTSLK